VPVNWPYTTRKRSGSWCLPLNHIPVRYFDAFQMLFRLENSLRVLVYVALKADRFDQWLNTEIPPSDPPQNNRCLGKESATIGQVFRQRSEPLRRHSYIGHPCSAPTMYLEFDELVRLMTSESYRSIFNPVFGESVVNLQSKLDEMRIIRNNLAHFRTVTGDDVERLEDCAKTLEPYVNAYLGGLTFDEFYVPELREFSSLRGDSFNQLEGTRDWGIDWARTDKWLKVTVRQTLHEGDLDQQPECDVFWGLCPALLWDWLHNVSGAAVFFSGEGQIHFKEYPDRRWYYSEGMLEVSLFLAIPRKKEEHHRITDLYNRLMLGVKEMSTQLSHAAFAQPSLLSRYEAVVFDPADVGPLIEQDESIPEDWSGVDHGGFTDLRFQDRYPWIPEAISDVIGEVQRAVAKPKRRKSTRKSPRRGASRKR
jgi:hypothetical protein